MTTFLVIWLWLTCYVLCASIQGCDRDITVSEMSWQDHAICLLIAPIVAVPVAVRQTFKRIFNV